MNIFTKVRNVALMAMFFMAMPCMAQSSKLAYRSGDVNGDGKVDVADIASIISIMSGDYIKDLSLSSTSINLMTGYGAQVCFIEGSGSYNVESRNPDVATACVEQQIGFDGNPKDGVFVVQINALKAGTTIIIVNDMVTLMANTITVTVTDSPEPIYDGSYVDMGLPSGTLWATCNIGASKPIEFGWYVAWGETAEKDHYSPDNYLRPNISTSLPDIWDVACVTLGDHWRMPTMEELEELLICTWSWEQHSGVQGARIIGPNGNSIFLPAASFKSTSRGTNYPPEIGTYGSYWGRNPNDSYATELVFGTMHFENWTISDFYWDMGPTGYRDHGRSVRPVYDLSYIPNLPETPVNDGEDFTSYITNPTYDNNNWKGWEGTPLSGYNSDNNAEHYNKDYDTYQTISELPKGTYRVGVQGFYRKGDYTNDYELWMAGDTDNNNALLYAVSSLASVSTPLAPASSAAISTELGGNCASVGDGLYIPDDMVAAGAWFEAGYYHNHLDVEVGDDGILTIGIKKDVLIDSDWTIIDNWTLYRISD